MIIVKILLDLKKKVDNRLKYVFDKQYAYKYICQLINEAYNMQWLLLNSLRITKNILILNNYNKNLIINSKKIIMNIMIVDFSKNIEHFILIYQYFQTMYIFKVQIFVIFMIDNYLLKWIKNE